jgi:GntR family transcriptional regulator
MFINSGVRTLLLQGERQKFLAEEWPRVSATIQRLGLAAEELLNGANGRKSNETHETKKIDSKEPNK